MNAAAREKIFRRWIAAQKRSERARKALARAIAAEKIEARKAMNILATRFGEGLPRRLVECLSHIRRGLTNKEIAAEMGCTERTVKFHAARLFLAMHVRDRAQLRQLADSWLVEEGGKRVGPTARGGD